MNATTCGKIESRVFVNSGASASLTAINAMYPAKYIRVDAYPEYLAREKSVCRNSIRPKVDYPYNQKKRSMRNLLEWLIVFMQRIPHAKREITVFIIV